MPEPFDIPIYQRAFWACLIIGFANGYTSAFVLLNRSPLQLSALSHSLLPGIAVATWLVGLSVVSAFLGSVAMALLTGILTLFLAQRTQLSRDTVLSVLYTGAFSFGVMLLTRIDAAQELELWLLGNILGLSDMDLIMSAVIGLLAVTVLSLFRRAILLNLFEADVARTLGVSSRLLNYGLFGLLILVLVTTLQAVGAILAIGFIVTPAATMRQLTSSVQGLFLGSAILGSIGAVIGLYGSYLMDLPAGASIVIVQSVAFLIVSFWKRAA